MSTLANFLGWEMPFDFPSPVALVAASALRTPMSEPDDQAFFQHLVQTHYQDLYRFAFSLAKRPEDASDLVQQVFITWAKKGHQLLDRSKAKSWLFTTLHRDFIHMHRRAARAPILLADEESNLEEMAGITPEMDRIIDGKAALQALQEMEAPFGEPMRMFYLSDLNYREIAEVLGVPIGTVMSRLSRGKAILRAELFAASPT